MTDLHPDVAASILEMTEEAGAEGLKWKALAGELAETLDDVWAAIGDRLLARQPLSKEYAGSVSKKVRAALAKFEEASK